MYRPLVSIIIPVFNGSNYLRESIDSALSQTYKNIEVLVVNDGSTDNDETERIALSYGGKVNYYYKENGGVSTALNYGIEKMNGDWFSWLSHDDLYLPQKIESGIERIVSNKFNVNKTIISCKTGLINDKKETIFHPKRFYAGLFTGNQMFKNLLNDKMLSGCSLLIPKTAIQKVYGFNAEYRFIQDWACWIELALEGNDFYLYKDELVQSRIHKNQDSIKLVKLHPIEVERHLIRLLNRFSGNEDQNRYYLKTILLYNCTTLNNKRVRALYISKLIEKNEFKIADMIIYTLFLIRGQFIWITKKLYRYFINIKHRGTK